VEEPSVRLVEKYVGKKNNNVDLVIMEKSVIKTGTSTNKKRK